MTKISAAVLTAALTTSALPAHAAPAAGEAAVTRVVHALSVRHDPPSCEILAAELATPGATFAAVAELNGLPWTAMRAARCAARLGPSEPAVARWLVDPARVGLAEMVVAELDVLPEREAEVLARVALAGPLAERLRPALRASARPALRTLAR